MIKRQNLFGIAALLSKKPVFYLLCLILLALSSVAQEQESAFTGTVDAQQIGNTGNLAALSASDQAKVSQFLFNSHRVILKSLGDAKEGATYLGGVLKTS